MWHPIIDIIEETMDEGKTDRDKKLESVRVLDIFSDDVLESFVEEVFTDEKERLVHEDWTSGSQDDEDIKLYLSLSTELQDRITDYWAHDYSIYALKSTMRGLLDEFDRYIDSIPGMAEEYDLFMDEIS